MEPDRRRSDRGSRPLAKSGLDLAAIGSKPGLSVGGRTRRRSAPVSSAPGLRRSARRTSRRPLIPARFSVIPAPKRQRIGSLGPASVFPRPPRRLGTLGQRAGLVRLISGSPRISAPPCPFGLLTFPRNRLLGKRPNRRVCAELPRSRWVSLWISVDGPNSPRRIRALRRPQESVSCAGGFA